MLTDFCVMCNGEDALHSHHMLPRVFGGEDDERNLVTLCIRCHAKVHGVNYKLSALVKAGQRSASNGSKEQRKSLGQSILRLMGVRLTKVRGRGRPPGAKNKPKLKPPATPINDTKTAFFGGT